LKKSIFLYLLICSFAFGQGLKGAAAKAKNKLKEIEDGVRSTFESLEAQTDVSFKSNSSVESFNKGVLMAPNKGQSANVKDQMKEAFRKKTKAEKAEMKVRKYSNFGDIGTGTTINNLRQGEFNPKVESKSDFFTHTVSRFYSFEVTQGNINTVCECTAETSRKVIWPLFLKNRKIFLGPISGLSVSQASINPFSWIGRGFNPIRNILQKVDNNLNCIIYNGQEKYNLVAKYSRYTDKVKLSFAQKIIAKLLPASWVDSGKRFSIMGTLSGDKDSFDLNTSYKYVSQIGDKSPMKVLTPPVSYTIKEKKAGGNYAVVKHPSKFEINNDYKGTNKEGILYGALLSAYFYKPLDKTYKSNNEKVKQYLTNSFVDKAQTLTYKEGNKNKEKFEAALAKQVETYKKQAAVDRATAGFNRNAQPLVKEYDNEKNIDIFYDALIRGPFGLY